MIRLTAPPKSPGQIAYEEDLRRKPLYHHGAPRAGWDDLDVAARWSWERSPVARDWRPRPLKAV